MVSDCSEFHNSAVLSSEQLKMFAVFEDGHMIQELTEREWKSSLRCKDVAILVHGYNSSYERAIQCFAYLSQFYTDTYDTLICYLWPGGERPWEYFQARAHVGSFLPNRFLSLLTEVSSYASSLDIVAHSMGCRLSLEALSLSSNINIDHLFLLAPAVSSSSLDLEGPYHYALNKARNAYIYFSQHDDVLAWAYSLAEWEDALGCIGPNHPEELPSHVQLINAGEYILNHTGYIQSPFIRDSILSAVEYDHSSRCFYGCKLFGRLWDELIGCFDDCVGVCDCCEEFPTTQLFPANPK